jgi:TRAP-type C4-dicarboxylate transport system substrate-binding protein
MPVARRTFLASAAASLALPAVIRHARGDAPLALKLHHPFSSVSSVHDKFLAPWARKVEAESSGKVRIDIFPSMQLGGAPAQLFDQARDGVADIVWTAPSLTPGRFPRIEMFELPFVPSRRALVSSKALQDFAAVNLKDEFVEVHPICFSSTDRSVMHTTRPVRTVEDIKDQKLHVQTRFAGEAMRLLGAHPVPMPGGQLPQAINQHVVDGCVDPWHMVPTFRLNDLLKTHTEFSDLSLSSATYVLAMNKAAYDRLPREIKTAIDNNSSQPAAAMAGVMWDLQAAAVADNVAQHGDVIVTLLPEAVEHWRKATEPVTDIWLKEMKDQKVDGAKLIASARVLLAKYAKEPEPQPSQTTPPAEQQVTTQPDQRPQAKVDAAPAGKMDAPVASSPASVTKPAQASAPPAAQPPHVAKQAPAGASPMQVPSAKPPAPASASAAPAAPPAPTVPVVKPVTPPPTVSATPPAPPPPVAAAAPTVPPPPVAKPFVPAPKVLDFPL